MQVFYYWIPTFCGIAILGIIGYTVYFIERRDRRRRSRPG